MSEQRVRELIDELVLELAKTEGVDEQTMNDARKLATDIDDLVNPEVDTSEYTVLDDAIALEASFAATHPLAERIIRELINNLSRIGI
ncbi:MAG: DUF4404 family protein [Sphingomonadales bacterium]|nr:DUF4404 family protein [Sphingomonadales bacterium]